MDDERFDSWSKALAAKLGSRRGFIRLIGAGAFGHAIGQTLLGDVEAKKRRQKVKRQRQRKRKRSRQRRNPPTADRGVNTQIIGGTNVPDGTYPFIAALLYFGFRGTPYERHFCGGALIGPSHVLTAAHCVDFIDLADLRVMVGRTRLNDNSVGSFRTVAAIGIHPDWGFDGGNYDVAVLTLASPITSVDPVALVTPGDNSLQNPGTNLKVIGWGDTMPQPGNRPEYPDTLQEVEIPVVPDANCVAEFGSYYDPAVMICAGEEGRDSCFGDSGGPVFGFVSGDPRVVGIVNYGIGCGSATPGAYAQVNATDITDFIENEIATCGGIDLLNDRNNCGGCGIVCDRATTNACVAGTCRCGDNPPCTAGQRCNRATGTCS